MSEDRDDVIDRVLREDAALLQRLSCPTPAGLEPERDGRPACPFYREAHLADISLAEHVRLCSLWHQDGAEALRCSPTPGAGLEPCPRCGGPQRWETSHSRCEACHWITPCCEGSPL